MDFKLWDNKDILAVFAQVYERLSADALLPAVLLLLVSVL